MHDASPVAVRLDIRPRIVLRDEAPPPRRLGFRLPPLAVPAAGYWLLMGGLTYFFAKLGPHPVDSIEPARAFEPAPAEATPSAKGRDPGFVAEAPAPLAQAPTTPNTPVEEASDSPPPEANSVSAEGRRASRSAASPDANPDDLEGSRRPSRDRDAARLAADAPRATLSFPEFTDSSREPAREHAADGPRIDSLFERASEPPAAAEAPTQTAPGVAPGPARRVVSCEAAIARNSEQLEIGGPRGPTDISREAYASILQNGSYLSGCSIPDRTVFEICAAVKEGRAVGVTVVSNPASPPLNACVLAAVSRLSFPVSPRLDVTHTRFDAARR